MGWSVYYELGWAEPPGPEARSRVASLSDAYNAQRGERSEPLEIAVDAAQSRGAIKIHHSNRAEDDYRALIATLAAIAAAVPGATARVSDDYLLLTGADPRDVRVEGAGRELRVHDEAALPPPRDGSPDELREGLRRAELVVARAKQFKSAVAEADLRDRPAYPQGDENGLAEALAVFEQWLRARGR